jgi:hypothetical protein
VPRFPRFVLVFQTVAYYPDILVESLIFEHQAEYYHTFQESTQNTDSALFIAFMLRMILDAVTTSAFQVGQLLLAIKGEMSREALQTALDLHDRKSFLGRPIKIVWRPGCFSAQRLMRNIS